MTVLLAACLAPFVVALAALPCRRPRALRLVTLAGAALELALVAAALSLPSGRAALGAYLALDAVGRVLVALVGGVGALSTVDSLLYWSDELRLYGPEAAALGRGVPRVRQYFFWQQAFIGTMLVAAASANLGVSWVAIELTTITSAVLVGFDGGARAMEAAWKYVVLCSVGLALALLPVIVFYALAGGGGLGALNWSSLHAGAAHFPAGPVRLAFLFALVGFGTKAGLAPLHTWLPDAHSEAPAPVSALLSGVLLATVLCTLVRICGVTAASLGPAFPFHLLLGAGLLSVAVATPFLLLQDDLKRLLAYSSVEQIGLVAIGFGLHTPLSTAGAVLQLLVHGLAKSGLFFTAGHIWHGAGTKRLSRLRGLGRQAPALAAAFLFGTFTLAGLPPFGMFLSELAILESAFASHPAPALLLVALLGVIFTGLAFYSARAVFGGTAGRPYRTPPALALVLAVPAVLSVAVGLWVPSVVRHSLTAVTALLLGGRPL